MSVEHDPFECDPEDTRDATEEEIAAFLEAMPVASTSGVKDPAENPEGWDLCRDFIDPLADELEAWLRKSEYTRDDVDSLQSFDVGLNGVGPDARVNAWRRAPVELDIPGNSRRSLEDHVRGLAEMARETLRRLDGLPPDGEDAAWRDVEIQGFAFQVVEPCLQFLRNLSRVVRKKLAGSAKRKQSRKTGAHRRTSEEIFKAALRKHHNYDERDDQFNYEPITPRGIEKLMEGAISDTTADRLLKKNFKSIELYKRACHNEKIRAMLQVLMGDVFKSVDPIILEESHQDDSDNSMESHEDFSDDPAEE